MWAAGFATFGLQESFLLSASDFFLEAVFEVEFSPQLMDVFLGRGGLPDVDEDDEEDADELGPAWPLLSLSLVFLSFFLCRGP